MVVSPLNEFIGLSVEGMGQSRQNDTRHWLRLDISLCILEAWRLYFYKVFQLLISRCQLKSAPSHCSSFRSRTVLGHDVRGGITSRLGPGHHDDSDTCSTPFLSTPLGTPYPSCFLDHQSSSPYMADVYIALTLMKDMVISDKG